MRSRGSEAPFRLFVVGTDTAVGKTESACALLSLLAARGETPAPFKPYESGCRDLRRPHDALRLCEAARSDDALSQVSLHRFRPPLAPGVAAAKLGQTPSFAQVLNAFRAFAPGRSLVAEGAGGLRVPLDEQRDMLDLVVSLRMPVLLVARAGLGTLNHTALSLDALRRRRVEVKAVLLVRSRPGVDPAEKDNPAWIAMRHHVRVLGPVPFVRSAASRRAAFQKALRPLLK
jgi:dethiobiotin synthetase